VTRTDFDAVIAGGGLAGLSLLAHLADTGWRHRDVLLVDDPTRTAPATCWGSWTTGADLLDDVAWRTYRRLRIYAGRTATVLPLGRYRYQSVRRPDLAGRVAGAVAGCRGFLSLPGHVEGIHDGPRAATVQVDGRPLTARWVFDARGPGRVEAPDARMAFTGWQVRSTAPVFDPSTPVLFDFRTAQGRGARFVYVLPHDPFEALVELTEFVPRGGEPPTAGARQEALATYLAEVAGCGDYAVTRTEAAVMGLRVEPPARGTGRVVAIGARAGLIKASTGYAYQRIQRDSRALATSLARHGHPFDRPPGRWRHRLLDAVLLELLDRDPGQLPDAFGRLFGTLGAESMLRFLDEDSTITEELRLMACLPPLPYLRALVATLARRSNRPDVSVISCRANA
jgi:lycopene beta-cyclase